MGPRFRALALLALPSLSLFTGCRMDSRPDVPADELAQVQIGGIRWYVDYDAAVDVAREQDKALWVHFGENPG